MADFGGGVFVGLDEEMVGDGTGAAPPNGSVFLDSFAEATVRGDHYYLVQGKDSIVWSPPVGDHDVTVVTGTRPFAGITTWWSVFPPGWVCCHPMQAGFELTGFYRVADGASGTASFLCKVQIAPVAFGSFSLARTEASTPQWQPFSYTISINEDLRKPWWGRFEWYGKSADIAASGSAADTLRPKTRSMLQATVAAATIYTEGSGSQPNTTSQEAHATKVSDNDTTFLVDHIQLYDPGTQDDMVINPSVPYEAAIGGTAQQRQLNYLQLAGVQLRPIWNTELDR